VLPVTNQFLLPNCVVCSELEFAVEMVLSAANLYSLLKLCCSQQINIRHQNCVVRSKLTFVVVCSESTFIAEIYVMCSESTFATKIYVVYSESAFAAQILCCL
jgi:hypothetical protein